MRNVVVVDSVRTGLAKSHRGTFNLTRPDDMVAHCINSLLDRNSEIDPAEVEDVIGWLCQSNRRTRWKPGPSGSCTVQAADHHGRFNHQPCMLIRLEFHSLCR